MIFRLYFDILTMEWRTMHTGRILSRAYAAVREWS